jgi:hypothetical protein
LDLVFASQLGHLLVTVMVWE